MKQIDLDGTVFLLDDEDGRYRYRLIASERGRVLLRDDGYRIYSMHIEEKAENIPYGQREWELLYEYKHNEAPGYRAVVELIMAGSTGEKA